MKKYYYLLSFLSLCFIAFSIAQEKKVLPKDNVPHSYSTSKFGGGSNTVASLPLVNFEDGQFPPLNWTLINGGSQTYTWTLSTAASGYGVGSNSTFIHFFLSPSGDADELISPAVTDLSPADTLSFDYAYATYQTEQDSLKVLMSTDGGTTFPTVLFFKYGPALQTAPATTSTFVPTAAQWVTFKAALPTVSGTNVKFKFRGISNFGNDLYLDNVKIIYIPRPHNISLVSFLSPVNNSINPVNQGFTPQIQVSNTGLNQENGIDVQLHIYKDVITNEIGSFQQTISTLDPGQTMTQSFDAFTPSDTGTYFMRCYSTLAVDDVRTNDTVLTTFTVRVPLSGSYNVGTGGDFPTITSAVTALLSKPVSGPVTFLLTNTIYNEFPISIKYRATIDNPVVIMPAPGVNATISVSGTFAICDTLAQYITIDGSNNGTNSRNLIINNNTGFNVIRVVGGAKYNTVKNCILRSSGTTNTSNRAVYINATSTTGGRVSYNVFDNNVISNSYDGFYFSGFAASRNESNVITNNKIGTSTEQLGHYGIFITNEDSLLIQGNEIQNITSATTDVAGILLSTGYTNAIVSLNYIHTISYTGASTSKVYGIYCSSATPHLTTSSFFNNIIDDLQAPTATNAVTSYNSAGIYNSAGRGNDLYFNSVYITGDQGNLSAPSYAFYNNDTMQIVADNIFANVSTGDTAKDYAIGLGTAANFNILNNNLYYVSGVKGYVGQFRGTATANDKKSFQNWLDTLTVFYANGFDQASFSGNPRFTSSTDLHIPEGTKSLANNNGNAYFSTSSDIDGDSRDLGKPDIGADEFSGQTPFNVDVAATSIDDPVSGRSKKVNLAFTPKATVTNEATTDATNITVNLTITRVSDNNVIYDQTANVPTLSPFVSYQAIFPVPITIAAVGDYTATETVSLSGDADGSNDISSFTFTVKDLIAGTFNVGSAQTYTSLTQAINDLKDIGVGGPITLLLQSSSYNEPAPLSITGISGLNIINPLTIKAGVAATVNFIGTLSEPWGLRLRGVEGVTIDGSTTQGGTDRSLSIIASGLYGKTGVLFDSLTSTKTQKNIIKNVIIQTGASSTIASTGYTGVYFNGAVKDTANQIINCEITNFGECGIRATKQYNLLIQSNYIHDWTQTVGATALKGIYLATGATNTGVLGNVITNIVNQVNGNSATGISNEVGSGSNLLCANNMISGMQAIGAGVGQNISRGIYSNAGGNTSDRYYYNSINLFGQDASTSTLSRSAAIEFGGSANSPTFNNNILVNSMTCAEGTAKHIFGYYLLTNPPLLKSNFNDIYLLNGVTGFDGTGNRITLSDWNTTTTRDSNSVSADPHFIDSTHLHLQFAIKTVAESWGTTADVGIVDADIDGTVRFGSAGYTGAATVGTDLGADEGDFVIEYWYDVAPTTVNNPANGGVKKNGDTFSPTATFKNVGFKRFSGFPVEFQLVENATNTVVYDQTAVISDLTIGASTQVAFPQTSQEMLANAGVYMGRAIMYNDYNISNDTLFSVFNVKGPLTGAYTVGATGIYSSITQALNELAVLGVNAAVTFNLSDSVYQLSTPIVIDSISGSSVTNTITLQGAPSQLNISGSDVTPDSASIRLRGASNVTISDITVNPLWTKARYGIWLNPTTSAHASNNTIQNCTIRTSATTLVNSGYLGVLMDSLTNLKDTNNRVLNCDISKFGLVGIGVRRNAGAIIEGNVVHDDTVKSGGSGTDIRGISINIGSTNSVVRGNIITNLIGGISGLTATGIHNNVGAGSSLLCANNIITSVRSGGSGTTVNISRGIASTNSNNSNDKYYYNTIVMSGVNSSTSNGSYSTGIDVTIGSGTSFAINNNNIVQSMLHSGLNAKSLCIRLNNTPLSTSWSSDKNNLYSVNAEGGSLFYIGEILASDYASLNDWQTATGKDAGSIAQDPRFVSSNNGHILTTRPTSPLNRAAGVLAEVTTDYDGDTRDASKPDIGADEFDVVNNLSGKVYRDLDGRLVTPGDRNPIPGWKVYLIQNSAVVDSQLTDDNGAFSFTNLTAGTYVLLQELQNGWSALQSQGGTGAEDIDTLSTLSLQVAIKDGDDAINMNFIDALPGIIAVRSYSDKDGKFYTSEDRTPKKWRLNIYLHRTTPLADTLLSTANDTVVSYIGSPGTYIITEADSAAWVTIGDIYNGPSSSTIDSAFSVRRDTINVIAGTSHEVKFINFLPNTITLRSKEDDDGSFIWTTEDRTAKNWSLHLYSVDSSVVFDTTVTSDTIITASYLPDGMYAVAESDTSGWYHLGIVKHDLTMYDSVRTTQTIDTLVVAGGYSASFTFVNSLIKPDTLKYRTFTQDDYVLKPVKLKPKKLKVPKGSPPQWFYPTPNAANIRDTVFKLAVSKGNPLYFGVPFALKSQKDSLKKFGWINITKGAALTGLFPQTGTPGHFVHKKELKDPKNSKFNNSLLGELVTLRVNILASYTGIIVPDSDKYGTFYFGDLKNQEEDTTSFYHNMPLRDIAKYADSLLTYGWRLDSLGVVVDYNKLKSIFQRANLAFRDTSHMLMDTVTYSPLRIKSTKSLADIPFLKRDFTPLPKSRFSFSGQGTPTTYSLYQNYPNPFNPTTNIAFDLPQEALVTITIYNILGQEITNVLNKEDVDAGYTEVPFDASRLSSGVYFYRLKAKSLESNAIFTDVKKMILMK